MIKPGGMPDASGSLVTGGRVVLVAQFGERLEEWLRA